MERIAAETEEDYQQLVNLLQSFGVLVHRPNLSDNYLDYMVDGRILPPPMCPRDWTIMIGDKFYYKAHITNSVADGFDPALTSPIDVMWSDALRDINKQNPVINSIATIGSQKDADLFRWLNSATTTRIGKDLYFGTNVGWWNKGKVFDRFRDQGLERIKRQYQEQFPEYRCHVIDTEGHADGTYCPVVPGLIVSLCDAPIYADTFPDWQVVHLKQNSWEAVRPFLELKQKNRGKWWVPGEELNDEFTDFVEGWLSHWVGYVEETVFDVNMLVIDQKNVACSGYNKQVFDKFSEFGITPHVINFRHRYFWDGGLHCVTSDISRTGELKDYFPERKL